MKLIFSNLIGKKTMDTKNHVRYLKKKDFTAKTIAGANTLEDKSEILNIIG